MTATPLALFNAGELDPYLSGREDIPAYVNGLSRALNAIVLPHGPVVRRPGNRRAGLAHANGARTLTFKFAVGDAYTVEIGSIMRFWKADGTLVAQTLAIPWNAQQVSELRTHQSGDFMWFYHPSVPTQQLRRLTLTPTFDLLPLQLNDGPYYAQNESGITMSIASTGSGSKVVTASSGVFVPEDIGRHLRIKAGGTSMQDWTWGIITAYSSATSVTVNFLADVATTAGKTEWRLGLYSQTTGYPSCGCIHQERHALGSMPANSFPRVDLSRSGDFYNWRPGTDDDHAIQLVISADAMPVIRDLKSSRVLVIVTASGLLRASGPNGPKLVPSGGNDVSEIEDAPGSVVAAVKARGSILYLDAQGRSVGEVRSKSEVYADAMAYREISIRNGHLLRDNPGVGLTWANRPFNQIVVVRQDGVLLLGAYNPDQEVIAFTPHELADTGLVLSANVLPTSVGDAIWMLVQRGSTKTVEVMTDLLRNTLPDREAVNLDNAITVRDAPAANLTYVSTAGDVQTWDASAGVFVAGDVNKALRVLERRTGLMGNDKLNMPRWWTRQLRIVSVVSSTRITVTTEIDGAPTSPVLATNWLRSFQTVTGLSILEGKSVRACVDGADLGPFTVASAQISLSDDAWVATVGQAYRSEVQPMPPAPRTKKGSTVARPIGGRSRVRVLRTGSLKQVNHRGEAVGLRPLREGTMAAGVPPPLYNGDLELEALPATDTPVGPILVSDGALPFCITSFAPDYQVGELG